MNHDSTTPSPRDDMSSVCKTLQTLHGQVAELERQSNRRRRRFTRIGIALGVASCIYLSFVTSRLFQLDAEALTEIGRQEVQRQLPKGLQSLRGYLKQEAPRVVSRLIDQMLQVIPDYRKKIVEDLDKKNTEIVSEFEEKLVTVMKDSVRDARASLDNLEGEYTDIEKIDILLQHVSNKMNGNIITTLDAAYPDFASELNRVKSFIVDLQHKDESELTERERVQKELIRTTLEIIAREGVTGPGQTTSK